MKLRTFPLFFTIAILWTTANAGCPSMCECSDSTVSCRSELLEGVPNFESLEVEPETIDLSDNSIFSIVATDFSFDGNENVQYLFLNNNHIVDINEKAFSELTNVKEINLNTNSLDSVPPMFVADNTQLASLDLSNNFFDLVTPEIYSESLEVLDLSSTKISSFGESNIKYLPNLKVLNLSYNRIQSIEPSVFDNLPNLLAVDLTGNFWKCDQKTIDLFNFLTDKGFTDVIDPVKCITEEGFYQDIYTSRGPVDIFSISLEGFADDAQPEPVNEPKEEVDAANEDTEDDAENAEAEQQQLEENVQAAIDEEINGNHDETVIEDVKDVENEETNDDNLQENAAIDVVKQVAEGNTDDEEDAAESENTGGEENVNEGKNKNDEGDNYQEDQYVNDDGLKMDNQDADENIDEALRELMKDNFNKDIELDEENDNDEDLDGIKNADETLVDKSLEEIILEKTGKDNVADITDTDVIDAINQLLKDEETNEDIDDYGDDYWDKVDEYSKPEEPKQNAADELDNKQEEDEAVEQAKKVIEEEERKENSESVASKTPDDSEDMEISVIREDQYIVLLERDPADESQYGAYFRSNFVSTLGLLAFVLAFVMGVFFGLYAIREAYTRRRRREIHGSTNVLINKWSEDLA